MNKNRYIGYNQFDKYLTDVRAEGRYSFTLEELKDEFQLDYSTIRQRLYRCKLKKQIIQIRQGFYVIIPAEYSKQGMLPPYLYIDELMKWLGKQYYVGLLSAAAMYGAGHQQPMGYSVITESSAPRSIEKLQIMFFPKRRFLKAGIVQKKTSAGYINVSSAERTALDLLDYIHKFGLNRITTIVQELSETMKPSALCKIAEQFPNTSAIQRLGYIIEYFTEYVKLSDALYKTLSDRQFFFQPLSPQNGKTGETDNKWKIVKNIEIESDI